MTKIIIQIFVFNVLCNGTPDIEILYNICLLYFDAVSLPLIKVQYLVVYKNFTLTVAQETSIEPGLAIGDRKKWAI